MEKQTGLFDLEAIPVKPIKKQVRRHTKSNLKQTSIQFERQKTELSEPINNIPDDCNIDCRALDENENGNDLCLNNCSFPCIKAGTVCPSIC